MSNRGSRKRCWRPTSVVKLDPRSHWQKLWDKWSLVLIFPRRVPEWVDDEVIDQKLDELERTERLPWAVN